MRRSAALLLALLVAPVFATPAVAAVDPPPGLLAHLAAGRVEFVRQNPSYPCNYLHLTVNFAVGTMKEVAPGGKPWDEQFANATYWVTNECAGGTEIGRLWGQVAIGPDNFSFDGLKSATLSEVAIPVSGSGYSQFFRIDLELIGTSHPSARNVHNGVLLPPDGAGVARWGERYNEHYVTADATGTVNGEAYESLFTTADVVYAAIGEFMQIWP